MLIDAASGCAGEDFFKPFHCPVARFRFPGRPYGRRTGHALPGSQNLFQLITGGQTNGETTIKDDLRVAIVAARVNPVGGENQPDSTGQPEMVCVLNRTTDGISLKGWSILNKNDTAHVISNDIWIAPGGCQTIVTEGAELSISSLRKNLYRQ